MSPYIKYLPPNAQLVLTKRIAASGNEIDPRRETNGWDHVTRNGLTAAKYRRLGTRQS